MNRRVSKKAFCSLPYISTELGLPALRDSLNTVVTYNSAIGISIFFLCLCRRYTCLIAISAWELDKCSLAANPSKSRQFLILPVASS